MDEIVLMQILKKLNNAARKSLIDKMHFPFDHFDFLNEAERENVINQIFELNLITLAVVGHVIGENDKIFSEYDFVLQDFKSDKIDDLSNEEDFFNIYCNYESEFNYLVSMRVLNYRIEIDHLFENRYYKPIELFYYYYLKPGILDTEYSTSQETEINNALNMNNFDEMDLIIAIWDVYEEIKKVIF